MSDTPMMVSLKGVGKRFQERSVLRDVTLNIAAGTSTLLVGPNGAGKSTLMRIMAGLIRPDTGEVERYCPDEALGYLGHATFIYAGLSALENVLFWCRLMGGHATEAKLLDVLDRVELGRYAHERAGGFSRGMMQRLNLARVLLQQPQLVLLDEPGTGLDVRSREMLRRETLALQNRGAAVVCITHDLEADASTAERVLALGGRKLVFDGTVGDYTAFLRSQGGASEPAGSGGRA